MTSEVRILLSPLCSPKHLLSRTTQAKQKVHCTPSLKLRTTSGSSSVGRALAFQAKGRGFEFRFPLKNKRLAQNQSFFCYMRYYVYILFSASIQKFYIGQTKDVEERLHRHNSSREKFTSKGKPWELVWFTSKESRSDAMILERKLKNLKQIRLLKFMQKYASGIQNLQVIELIEKKFGS